MRRVSIVSGTRNRRRIWYKDYFKYAGLKGVQYQLFNDLGSETSEYAERKMREDQVTAVIPDIS